MTKQKYRKFSTSYDARPVCSEMWPGNTADVTTLIPVIDRLRRRSTSRAYAWSPIGA
jgi:transposase